VAGGRQQPAQLGGGAQHVPARRAHGGGFAPGSYRFPGPDGGVVGFAGASVGAAQQSRRPARPVASLPPLPALPQVLEAVRPTAAKAGLETPLELWGFFVARCRANLHLLLALSPAGTAFRERLRANPALVNCCTIDWFFQVGLVFGRLDWGLGVDGCRLGIAGARDCRCSGGIRLGRAGCLVARQAVSPPPPGSARSGPPTRSRRWP
jgi:hypothetical protein